MLVLNGRRNRVEELAFSHCGKWLAAAGSGGGLHVWDTTRPSEKAEPVTLSEMPLRQRTDNLAFRRDGRVFCSAWDGWFLVHPETRAVTRVSPQKYGAYTVSPDASRVVRTCEFNPLRTYVINDTGPARAGPTYSVAHTYFAHAAFSLDGTTLAVEEVRYVSAMPTRRIALRSADATQLTGVLPVVHETRSNLRFSPDGALLAGWNRASLVCWMVATPDDEPRWASNPSRKHFLSLAVHPEGRLLTVDNDRLVRVWNATTLAPERTIEWNVGKLYAVAVSPDGMRVAVGSHTGKVLVWDWD